MYAVVVSGGKQYRVSEGARLRVEKIDAEVGATVELGPVRLLSGQDGLVLGADQLSATKVLAEVTNHGRRKKIRVFKYKRRKNYRRTIGHRQSFTEVLVKEIKA